MLEIKENHLYLDGCNTVALAKKYGTPLYLISENKILEQCNEIKKSFTEKYEKTKVVYASKAFLPLAMCAIMAREGFGLDVVSGGELYTALMAKFPTDKIEFSGNNKSHSELEMAVEHRIGRITVDNQHELEMLIGICKKQKVKMKILFRIIPGVKSNTHDYISTGSKDSKFGFSLEKEILIPAIEQAIASDYIDFKGIHFHVGSQLHDNTAHLGALEQSLKLIKHIKDSYNYDIEDLDIGGGYGIKYTEKDQPKPLSYFLDPVMSRVKSFCADHNLLHPQVIIEPGRWIIGEAGITLYEIGAIKRHPEIRNYVAIDGGMSDNIRPCLYQAEYSAIVANKANAPLDELVTIAGKFCESSDILIKDIKLPKTEPGDYLAVMATGAYNYSMASNYNKNIIPAVVLLNKGKDSVIVKRQDYSDIIRNEVMPASLLTKGDANE